MQLKFTALTMRNFISTGAVTQSVDLEVNGLTLVLGQHTDSNGEITRNGAGKSTILQAISYALYGEGLSSDAKIKVDNFVNDINMKNMLVSLDFEVGATKYQIERGRKPSVLKFYRNGEEFKDETLGENRETQRDIDTVVGMDHTMFSHIVAINTLTTPFLKSTAAVRRDIMEKLMGVTQISERAKVLSKKISGTKDTIKTLEAQVLATQETNRRIQVAFDDAKKKVVDWDTTHQKSVSEIAAAISGLIDIDIDGELAKLVAIDEYDKIKGEYQGDLSLKLKELELLDREQQTQKREAEAEAREIARLKRESEQTDPRGVMQQLKEARDEAAYQLTVTDRTLATQTDRLNEIKEARTNANTSTCSTCGQGLDGTSHLDRIFEKLDKERLGVEAAIDAARVKSEASREKHEHMVKALDDYREVEEREKAERVALYEAKVAAAKPITANKELEEALVIIAADVERLNSSLKSLGIRPSSRYRTQSEIFRIKQDREALENERLRLSQEKNPHVGQIAAFEAAIVEIDFKPLDVAKDLFKHQDYLLKLLTRPDSFIRKKIVDQNLHNLNQRLVYYGEQLMLPHQIEFQSDLSVEITKLGKDYDFAQLSRGEGNRLIMAMSLSFRDLWESLNHNVNLLFIDEMLDTGMDQTGAEAGLQILKTLGRDRGKNVFLISHKEELRGRIDRTLLVSKEDGFSRFELADF